ncbi:sensor histidine kinase [Thermomonospora echinospora]|uniref:sensor histidine kinase n=1 Tax=Thermomonospora echinospora TaxID=1992 RepID=UPI001F1A5897|nr:sensor histidine kinase [Thermomonospora echinospora]
MSALSSPLLKRVSPVAWSALAWCGAVAFPVLLLGVWQSGSQDPALLQVLLPASLTVLLVGLLRRRPLPALALMLAGSFTATATVPSWETGYLLALANDLAVGFVVATRPRWTAIAAVTMTLLVQVGSASYYTSGQNNFVSTVVFLVMALLTAWTAGRSLRERREHAAELRAQAAARAVAAERLRIARELHDMIAHSVGVIAIQAGMGARVMDTRPEEARKALAAIEATSRETLTGLRRTVSALRRAEPGGAPLTPAPGLADVDRLVASSRDAGVRIEVTWRGRRRPVPSDVDLAAFRIVQEAVTNVVRHAGVPACRVTVEHGDDELVIEVDDDGRGGVPGTGYGLVGMRERVALLGGRFSAGPRPDGGFRVRARLPLPEQGR